MLEIENGRLGLYGIVYQFEESGFKGLIDCHQYIHMLPELPHAKQKTYAPDGRHDVRPWLQSYDFWVHPLDPWPWLFDF